MPTFDPSEELWGTPEWRLFQNGYVHLYWQSSVLEETIGFLTKESYRIIRLAMSAISSTTECLRVLGAALEFPDYYGVNLNAFNDCLSDVAAYDYGSRREAMGTILVLERFDSFLAIDRPVAEAILDIFARQARTAALFGHRMLCLVQSDDPDVQLPAVGAVPVQWNPAEWLDSKRHLER